MSNSVKFLTHAILVDGQGERSRIIKVRGAEEGLNHLEVTTQSSWERENGIATVHRITSEEVTV